jgi:hypothetical protein
LHLFDLINSNRIDFGVKIKCIPPFFSKSGIQRWIRANQKSFPCLAILLIITKVNLDFTISTLDLLPTFYAAAGGNFTNLGDIDGVDLETFLTGKKLERPHDFMYWKKDARCTVREGDWKVLRFPDRPAELYRIDLDISEQNNLALKYHDRMKTMYKMAFEWEKTLERPRCCLKKSMKL